MTPSGMDGLGVGAATVSVGLEGWREEYTLSSSAAEAADIATAKNPNASEFES